MYCIMYMHRRRFFVDKANSDGVKCFCEVWLNLIILFQFGLLPPNSGKDHQKKGLRHIPVRSQSGITDFLLTSGYCLPKTEGTRHISPPSASDPRGRRSRLPQNRRLCIRVCTFFTFFSDRLVYMILRGQIDPKHQCKNFFFNFVVLVLCKRGQRFLGGRKPKFLLSRKVWHLKS